MNYVLSSVASALNVCIRLQEVFTVGEKIQCLILGIEYDYSNISLSTAELETSDYTVLNNKAKVWEEAGRCTIWIKLHLVSHC